MGCTVYKPGELDSSSGRFSVCHKNISNSFAFRSIGLLNPAEAAEELEKEYGIVMMTGDTLEVTKDNSHYSKARKFIVSPSGEFESYSLSKWKKYNGLVDVVRFVVPYGGGMCTP